MQRTRKTGTAVAQKLVDDHVVAVVGHLNSGMSIPASKIYSDAGIVQISPSATNPAYTQQGFKTTYRVVATDAQQGPALANYATKALGAKSIASWTIQPPMARVSRTNSRRPCRPAERKSSRGTRRTTRPRTSGPF